MRLWLDDGTGRRDIARTAGLPTLPTDNVYAANEARGDNSDACWRCLDPHLFVVTNQAGKSATACHFQCIYREAASMLPPGCRFADKHSTTAHLPEECMIASTSTRCVALRRGFFQFLSCCAVVFLLFWFLLFAFLLLRACRSPPRPAAASSCVCSPCQLLRRCGCFSVFGAWPRHRAGAPPHPPLRRRGVTCVDH